MRSTARADQRSAFQAGGAITAKPYARSFSATGGALFHALLAAGVDPAAAYTAVREMESMAGQSVVTQLGAQIQGLATTLDRMATRLENVETRLENLETLKADVAVLKREVRLIWAALFLAVPTLTAILVRFFGS